MPINSGFIAIEIISYKSDIHKLTYIKRTSKFITTYFLSN